MNQLTSGLQAAGLRPGDGIAALLPNSSAAFEVYLAALQGGWYLTPINWHFTPPEIAYMIADSGAKAFFAHERFAEARRPRTWPRPTWPRRAADVPARFSYGEVPGFTPVAELRQGQPTSAAGRPDRGRDHALHLGHHGPAQGRAPGAVRPRPRRGRRPRRRCCRCCSA